MGSSFKLDNEQETFGIMEEKGRKEGRKEERMSGEG